MMQDPRCLMCSPDFQEDSGGELSYLRLHKPTENRGWVHVLCAVFCPEIQFTDASQLRLVEGLASVPEWKRSSVRCLYLPYELVADIYQLDRFVYSAGNKEVLH